jgi:uncharacterized protein
MQSRIVQTIRLIVTLRWNPNRDLALLAVSWLLVVGCLYTANVIVGSQVWGGMAYFALYAVLGASIFGVGLPLYWTVVVRKRPVCDLGVTRQHLLPSIAIQLVLAVGLYFMTLAKTELPSLQEFLPLLALALTIGFFEAIFWRGWMLLRLEDAFGLLPAILIGSFVYAAYHIGYGMPTSEMVFLFFIGVMFAVIFRLTKSIFILWPFFQPMGQLVTLVKDGLSLPVLAALGFIEAFILMVALVWLADRYYKRHGTVKNSPRTVVSAGHPA